MIGIDLTGRETICEGLLCAEQLEQWCGHHIKI